jgi:molybdenum cofactor guanylyltransferase
METLAMLAGGGSTRMGQDKALMPFHGRLLILRVWERLISLAEDVIVSTNHPADYAFMGLPTYPDILPDCGSLGGLYTMLQFAKHSIVAAVACDMPFANPDLFKYERLLLSQSGADVVIPATPEGLEPLHAVYRRETCLPVIETALKAGQFKMVGWLEKVTVRLVLPEEIAHFDPKGLAFWNVNTPEEFRRAEELARAEEDQRATSSGR